MIPRVYVEHACKRCHRCYREADIAVAFFLFTEYDDQENRECNGLLRICNGVSTTATMFLKRETLSQVLLKSLTRKRKCSRNRGTRVHPRYRNSYRVYKTSDKRFVTTTCVYDVERFKSCAKRYQNPTESNRLSFARFKLFTKFFVPTFRRFIRRVLRFDRIAFSSAMARIVSQSFLTDCYVSMASTITSSTDPVRENLL